MCLGVKKVDWHTKSYNDHQGSIFQGWRRTEVSNFLTILLVYSYNATFQENIYCGVTTRQASGWVMSLFWISHDKAGQTASPLNGLLLSDSAVPVATHNHPGWQAAIETQILIMTNYISLFEWILNIINIPGTFTHTCLVISNKSVLSNSVQTQ